MERRNMYVNSSGDDGYQFEIRPVDATFVLTRARLLAVVTTPWRFFVIVARGHCDPLDMVPNSFLHYGLYLSSGGVTRGLVRPNHVCANNLVHDRGRAFKIVALYSYEATKSNDRKHEAFWSSCDLYVTSGHLE